MTSFVTVVWLFSSRDLVASKEAGRQRGWWACPRRCLAKTLSCHCCLRGCPFLCATGCMYTGPSLTDQPGTCLSGVVWSAIKDLVNEWLLRVPKMSFFFCHWSRQTSFNSSVWDSWHLQIESHSILAGRANHDPTKARKCHTDGWSLRPLGFPFKVHFGRNSPT